MLMRAIPALAVTAFCAASLWQIVSPPDPRLIYNQSASAPLGWYVVEPKRTLKRGDKVAAFAPMEARRLANARGYLPAHIPLIKTVWATGGTQVCHDGPVVRVMSRPDLRTLEQDSLGRPLPTRSGCYRLRSDEVFLVSTDVQTSWDSRYFGPVLLNDVIGPVRYLGERLGTGGRGGQDKRREARTGAIPLSAHHFRGAYGPLWEAPAWGAPSDEISTLGRPPYAKLTRKPPGVLK